MSDMEQIFLALEKELDKREREAREGTPYQSSGNPVVADAIAEVSAAVSAVGWRIRSGRFGDIVGEQDDESSYR